MTPIILGIFRRLLPVFVAAPFVMVRAHVGSVTYTEKQRARRPILVFVHLAGRVNDKGAGRNRDTFRRCSHGASAGKAEVDFGGMRMTMIGADLAGLPASQGEVTLGYFAEDLFNMVLGIPLLFALEAEDMHSDGALGEFGCAAA